MKHTVRLEGKPQPKERARTVKGHSYTPKKTKDAEEEILWQYAQSKGPWFDGPVEMTLAFHKDHTELVIADAHTPSKLRGDIDNYVKTVQDALQGVAYDNDKQVVKITATKVE